MKHQSTAGHLVRSVAAGIVALAPLTASAIQCRVTVTPLNFGLYMPLRPTHLDVVGNLAVRCQAQPGTFSVTIGPGNSLDASARQLVSASGETLLYNLFRDPGYFEIWGDGTPPTFTVTGVRPSRGRPTFYDYDIYGRIFANQAPNPGVYSDNLLVTVLF